MLEKRAKTMMRNFQLLESEHDHTGSPRQGPLAAFDELFRGADYFHIRRVYRGVAGGWSPTGNGISCRLDQRDAMLAVLAGCLSEMKARTKSLRKRDLKPRGFFPLA